MRVPYHSKKNISRSVPFLGRPSYGCMAKINFRRTICSYLTGCLAAGGILLACEEDSEAARILGPEECDCRIIATRNDRGEILNTFTYNQESRLTREDDPKGFSWITPEHQPFLIIERWLGFGGIGETFRHTLDNLGQSSKVWNSPAIHTYEFGNHNKNLIDRITVRRERKLHVIDIHYLFNEYGYISKTWNDDPAAGIYYEYECQ